MKADEKERKFGKQQIALAHPKNNSILHPDNRKAITQREASQACLHPDTGF
jgi:hypothetical protein